MAKARKLTISRSERYLGSSSSSYTQQTPNAAATEFGEDDIFSVLDNMDRGGGRWNSRPVTVTSGHHVGGLSLAFDGDTSSEKMVKQLPRVPENPIRSHFASSAPVNVPDWSKIYRLDSGESLYQLEDDDLGEPEIVPPHDYLARVNTRSRRMAPNSVFEGVGRTLKGRDMSRVRDAVWDKTGFYG